MGSVQYGRVDGYYITKVFDISLNGEPYHIKSADWTNGGGYTVIWKGDEENYPDDALGISGSHSEWASAQCGVDKKDLIRFINANPNRFEKIFDSKIGKSNCCGLFPTLHIESLCEKIMSMPTETELIKEKEQEIIDSIQDLANKKDELQKKEQDAKELLERYEELNGNKEKSVTNK